MKLKNSNNKKSLYTPYNNFFSSLREREDSSVSLSHVLVELMPISCVPLPQGNNVLRPSRPKESATLLNYRNFQLVDLST